MLPYRELEPPPAFGVELVFEQQRANGAAAAPAQDELHPPARPSGASGKPQAVTTARRDRPRIVRVAHDETRATRPAHEAVPRHDRKQRQRGRRLEIECANRRGQ